MGRRPPQGFDWIRSGSTEALVREEMREALGPFLLGREAEVARCGERLPGGRGDAYRLRLVGGQDVVVRPYRRGGIVARFVKDVYWGPNRRPFEELATTVEARRRGAPVPEVVGAAVHRLFGGWYRGSLATRYLPDTETLLAFLIRTEDRGARSKAASSTGRAIRTLHDAGISHPDLNLNNCLVRARGEPQDVFIIDLDRCQARTLPLDPTMRRGALRRLERSARKLDPGGLFAGPEEIKALHEGYGSVG